MKNGLKIQLFKRVRLALFLIFCLWQIPMRVFATSTIAGESNLPVSFLQSAKVSLLDGETISIFGAIDQKTRESVSQLFSPAIRRIQISSPGGILEEALIIADLVFVNKLDVVINGWCSSACALVIFPAGNNKTVGANGVVTTHWQANEDFNVSAISKAFPETAKRWVDIMKYDSQLLGVPYSSFNSHLRKSITKDFYRKIGLNPMLFSFGMALSICHANITIVQTKTFFSYHREATTMKRSMDFGGNSGWEVYWMPTKSDWERAGLKNVQYSRDLEIGTLEAERLVERQIGQKIKIFSDALEQVNENLCPRRSSY